MAEIRFNRFQELLSRVRQGNHYPVVLFFGRTFLAERGAKALIDVLLSDEERGFNLRVVDGTQGDVSEILDLLKGFPMLGSRRVVWVKDASFLQSRATAKELFARARTAAREKKAGRARDLLVRMCFAAGMEDENHRIDRLCRMDPEDWKNRFGFSKSESDDRWMQELAEGTSAPSSSRAPMRLDEGALEEAVGKGFAGRNVLILTTAAVDRRKRLYRLLSEQGMTVDCTVEEGASRKAHEQRRLVFQNQMQEQLEEAGKTMTPSARELFLRKAGVGLRSFAMELEKLITYVGDRETIDRHDVAEVVSPSREAAVFEIMDALGERDARRSFQVLDQLWDQGFFPLAVLKVIADQVRRLLWARSRFGRERLSYERFQRSEYPRLDEEDRAVVGKMAPFGIYRLIQHARRYRIRELERALCSILEADIALKTGCGDPKALLASLLSGICMEEASRRRGSAI